MNTTRNPREIDLTGQRFARWIVISKAEGRRGVWLCVCDCGLQKNVHGRNLRHGYSKSCGCLKTDFPSRRTHGATAGRKYSPEYRSWSKAKARCNDLRDISYPNYGGRGIRMCKEWSDSFEAFLRDMGPRLPGHSIDRIDNSKGYEPGNTRWSQRQQQIDNRSITRHVVVNGVRVTLGEASRNAGVPYRLVHLRLRRGWPIERALGLN